MVDACYIVQNKKLNNSEAATSLLSDWMMVDVL